MNVVAIGGRVVEDPETKASKDGKKSVCSANIAVFGGKNGMGKDIVFYFRVVGYGEKGEILFQNYKKGQKIFVEGYLQQRKFMDKNGMKREVVEIVARNFDSIKPPKKRDVLDVDEDDIALGNTETFSGEDDGLPF